MLFEPGKTWRLHLVQITFQLIISGCIAIATISEHRSFSAPITFTNGPKVIRKGDNSDVIIAIGVPGGQNSSFPRISSKELNDEGESITSNSTMISGVARRFRSARAYSYPTEYPARFSSRFSRFDHHRNGIESDGFTSSSWGDKWFNKLRRKTGMAMSMSPSSPMDNQMHMQSQGMMTDEPDMAATFMGYGGGGGHGGGGGGYGKGVNKSAVGLLGFLSLLSLIQNVLNQTSMGMGMGMGRRRRDLSEADHHVGDNFDWDGAISDSTNIMPFVLPMMNAVNQAQNGAIQTECTLQPICSANRVLTKNLGEKGKSVGQIMSTAISKMLQRVGWQSNDWDIAGKVIRAGMSGRNGKNCTNLYKNCPELDLYKDSTPFSPVFAAG